VIAAPDGAAQAWPPALGLTVEAVVAADLDQDGSSDLVVVGSGADNQAGMYVIEGRRDLVYGTSKPVKGFSRFVPSDLGHPVAANLIGNRVGLTYYDGVMMLSLRSSTDLEETGLVVTGVLGGGATPWARTVVFPGAISHIAISDGNVIEHVTEDLFDAKPLPAPGSSWNLAQLATSYAAGADQIAVVATPDAIYRAVMPTGPGGAFSWQTVRSGTAWLGQTAYDFDGDGREEIVGYEPIAHEVCAIDPGATALPTTPTCVATMTEFDGSDVTLVVGTNLTNNPGLDILVAQASGGETAYSIIEDVTYSGGVLSATLGRAVAGTAGPARGKTVIANDGPGTPYVVLTFGTDGVVTCALGPC
jgi:hypothetical protein